MKGKLKKNYTDPWKEYANRYEKFYWEPGKPTKQEKKIFYKFIKEALKKRKKTRALILGATPSIRDELAKFNVEVTLIDINKNMINEMSKLTTHKKKEIIVKGNWINTKFPDNHFDIVMGDLVLGNLDAKHQPKFLKEVKRILKQEGYWIHRMFFFPPNWKFESTEQVLKKFSKMKHNYDRSTELLVYLVYNTYNKKTHEVYTREIKKTLKKYWKKDKYIYPNDPKVEELMNEMYTMYKPLKKTWYTGTKKEVFSRISKFFKIIKEDFAKDHYFGRSFIIIVCKPK
ncbi:hypothetical protein CEE44_04770 [Candidatus Woesearchaeota archaeon B3_Woes]|nr:MAG: hypothetical protein CEE44_04770 [Candidatus Woesearchaeota archaeon B3_Woes]